jgi:hypothetical protein
MHGPHDSATTPRAAGHRIKSFEPMPLDLAPMSPRRLGPPRSTFTYFEDTLEIARLHNSPAFIHAASDREGSERLPSADRSQRILNSAGRHRDSAARLG